MSIRAGYVVTVDYDGKEVVYQLGEVSDLSANPPIISVESPLGKALLNKKIDEGFTVKTPSGIQTGKILGFDKIDITQEDIEESLLDQTKDIHEHCKEIIDRKNGEIAKIEEELLVSREETKRLRDGFKTPEFVTKGKTKKEVLQEFILLYQQMMKMNVGKDIEDINVNLSSFDTPFHNNDVVMFGIPGSMEKYDPDLHESYDRDRIRSDKVTIVCPGFRWNDYLGRDEILARAQVKESFEDYDLNNEVNRHCRIKSVKRKKIQEITKRHIFRKNISG